MFEFASKLDSDSELTIKLQVPQDIHPHPLPKEPALLRRTEISLIPRTGCQSGTLTTNPSQRNSWIFTSTLTPSPPDRTVN